MRLTIVGCSGSYPGPDSPASCYLVEHEGHSLVLDLGNGAFGALQKHTDVYDVDAVVLSHLHADHCIDLTSYYVFRKYHPDGHAPVIPVIGPTGSADRLARAYDLPPEEGMHGEFEFRDHVEVTEIGPFRITTALMNHPVPCYASASRPAAGRWSSAATRARAMPSSSCPGAPTSRCTRRRSSAGTPTCRPTCT